MSLATAAAPDGARTDSPKARFSGLDGLRAIAALAVLVTHVSINATGNRGAGARFLSRLDVGVWIFFVLSGFLLYRPFVTRRLAARPLPDLRQYLRNRLLRILPLYWLVLTVAVFIYPGPKPYRLGDLAGLYTFTYVYRPHANFGPIVQGWSLAAEMAFYLFLPVYAAFLARLPGRTLAARYRNEILGIAVLVVTAQLFRLWAVGLDNPADRLIRPSWFINYLDVFGAGMLLAVFWTWCRGRGDHAPRWTASRWLPAASWGAAAALFIAVSTVVDLPIRDLTMTTSKEFARHLLYTGVAVGLVIPAIIGPDGRGAIRRFLASPVMAWLGLISYGIFLWQNVVIARYLDRHPGIPFQLSFWRALLFTLAFTLVVATGTYYLVERPVLKLKRRRLSRFAAGMWTIGLVGLAWRLIALLTINARDPDGGDPFYYHYQANLLSAGHGFAEPFHWVARGQLLPTAVHPPLMTMWLSVSSFLGGQSWLAHKTMAAIAGAGVVVIVGLLARELWNPRAGLLAAALAAAYPNLWIIDGTLWPEGLFSLILGAALLCTYRWIRHPSTRFALAIGLLVGLATLARGEAILLLPLLAIPVFLRSKQVPWRRRLAWAGGASVIAILVLLPWSVRNLLTFNDPVFVSTNSEEVLYYANCPDVYSGPMIGYWSFNCQERVRRQQGEPPGDESQRSKEWRARGVQYAQDHSDRLLPVAAARLGRVWDLYRSDHNMAMMNIEGRPLKWSRVGRAFYWAALPLAAAGFWLLRRRKVPIWPLAAMFVLVAFTAVTVYGGIRFRAPAELAMVVLAGVAVDAAISSVQRARHPAPVAAEAPRSPATAETSELAGARSARRALHTRRADGT